MTDAQAPGVQAHPREMCSVGRVLLALSGGRTICAPASLVPVLKMFIDKGYRVEATKTRIVVYDERGEEVFSSSL